MKIAVSAAALLLLTVSTPALASTCAGSCGALGPDGVVTSPPIGGPNYSYVTTVGGVFGGGEIAGVGGTNGSEFVTDAFSAASGDALNFAFNYVTSDGAGFADYAFAELLTSSNAHVAYLFTARTTPSGDTSPGFGLPSNDSTLSPSSTPIIPGGPVWSPLAGYSGACYSAGCGYTGWITSNYVITDPGNYVLRLGVSNFLDTAYDSGLAFAGVTIAGNPIPTPGSSVPEPSAWAMMLAGFGALGGALRMRRRVAFAAA